MLIHENPEAVAKDINPFDHGPLHTDLWKTEGLRQALDAHGFDAAFGGARRDEEKSRAKERIFSFRSAQHRWDPKRQRPELWSLYNVRKAPGESMRVFPLSQLDRARHLAIYHGRGDRDRPALPRRAAPDGGARRADPDGRRRALPAERRRKPVERSVRFRTLGCYPLSGAVESEADTIEKVVQEMLLATTCERQGRIIDRDGGDGSMEKKKQEGYF